MSPGTQPAGISEFAKVQLQQAVDTFRAQLSLIVQICVALIAADAATIGYAIQQKFGAALWVGLFFLVAMIVAIRAILRMTIPIVAIAIAIETRHRDPAISGLLSTFVAVAVSEKSLLEQIRLASQLPSEPERWQALMKIEMPVLFGGHVTRYLLYSMIVAQAVAPFLLRYFANWGLVGK
jgi:hypothetical protein